jgi:hypothetical protein
MPHNNAARDTKLPCNQELSALPHRYCCGKTLQSHTLCTHILNKTENPFSFTHCHHRAPSQEFITNSRQKYLLYICCLVTSEYPPITIQLSSFHSTLLSIHSQRDKTSSHNTPQIISCVHPILHMFLPIRINCAKVACDCFHRYPLKTNLLRTQRFVLPVLLQQCSASPALA